MEDIEDWVGVIRSGREEKMRELAGEGAATVSGDGERRNVRFSDVLERVRFIEPRDECEDDEESAEDEAVGGSARARGDAVAASAEVEYGVEPEQDMEDVVATGVAWC